MLVSNIRTSLRQTTTLRTLWSYSFREFSSKPPKADSDISNDSTAVSKRRIPSFPKNKLSKSRLSCKGEDDLKGKNLLVKSKKSKKIEDELYIPVELKVESSNNSVESPNYIPFKNFPKVPESILNQSLEELYATINSKPWINTNTVVEPSEKEVFEKPENYVDFTIPDKYLKSKIAEKITDKDRALVEELDRFLKSEDENEIAQSQFNLIKLYYDQDTNSYKPLPEHTLKKSLSGMINLNPSLNDIDDEYLWKLIPKDKLFAAPPFEQKITKDGFKKWEQEMLEKEKREKDAKEVDQKEFREFELSLNNSKTFFRKPCKGGRRKLDRKLMKEYKKLKEEGKIPKDFDPTNDDYDKLF